MKKIRTASSVVSLLALCVCAVGCDVKFWDPSQVGRFKPVPAVNVILDSLGVVEETPAAWEAGEDPKPADVVAYDTDYVFGPGDVVNISIFELFQEGILYANQFVITETGKLSIPDVGVVNAGGLTESQLEEEIKQILSPNILKSPSVTVTLFRSQSRLFSILGNGVPKPGLYDIPRYDYRLADALAIAGGISQFNISYIYVSRPITGKEALAEPAPPSTETPKANAEKAVPPAVAPATEKQDEMQEIIAPIANRGAGSNIVIASTEMAAANELDETALPETLQESGGSNQKTDSRPMRQSQRPARQRTKSSARQFMKKPNETTERPTATPKPTS